MNIRGSVIRPLAFEPTEWPYMDDILRKWRRGEILDQKRQEKRQEEDRPHYRDPAELNKCPCITAQSQRSPAVGKRQVNCPKEMDSSLGE